MKNVSQSFKDNIKKYGRQLDSRIKIGNSIIGKQDINGINPSFHTSLFKTVMKSFEIDCNLFIPKDEIINISIGVKFGNSGYEYIEYENFKVKSCEKQEDTESFKIIAYDKIMESMIDYDLELTQAISLREYIIKIFERLTWSTEGIPATFINSTKQINPSVHIGIGYTFRDVLDEIATITGSFIYIKNNVPTLGYITETNETINEEYLSQDDVTIGEKYLINSLVFSRAEESDNIFRKDDESIQENGLYEFRVEDNQIISTNDRDVYIDELFNYLKTLEFYIYDVKSTGIMWLDICDKFTFDIHGSTYSTIILNDEITVDQDIEEMLYVERPEETATDYKCADTTDKRINQAYILVNKQKQEITQRVNSVEQEFNKSIENLQSQIDGSIQFWNGSDIPTASNYPASDWTTEEEKNKHRADIYTVIEDIDGELKQGKSYRFDKVGNAWQWIELTDNELSAVQALAQSKARVFVTTPKVPYSIGDLWLNNGKLYECQTAKDNSGSYSSTDWKEAVNYTDDTVANLAKTLANTAQSTADSAVEGVANITNTTGEAEGKNIHIEDSAEEPLVDISLHGETRQETRSGKNILNINNANLQNCTTTLEENKLTVTASNTSIANVRIPFSYKLNTQYTFSFKAKFLEGLDVDANPLLYFRKDSTNVYRTVLTKDELNNSYVRSLDNFTEEGYELWIYMKTTTDIEGTISIEFEDMQIEEGSSATEYEPYGVMPSPDYPSEIENVEGRNMVNPDTLSDGYISSAGAFVSSTANKCTDYIPVSNNNYIFSAYFNENERITYSYQVAFFDGQKNFISRQTVSHNNSFLIDDEQIKYVRVWQAVNSTDVTPELLQLEKGTVATPYVPYNSLEVKVEGKNRFDVSSIIGVNTSTDVEVSNNHLIITAIGTVGAQYARSFVTGLDSSKSYTFSFKAKKKVLGTDGLPYIRIMIAGSNDGETYKTISVVETTTPEQGVEYSFLKTLNGYSHYRFYVYNNASTPVTIGEQTEYYDIQLEEGDTVTDYEPYKSQTAYSSLSEGQKLMEESYLADDGVHNKRKQYVFTGTETFKNVGVVNDLYRYDITFDDIALGYKKAISTHFMYTEEKNFANVNEVSFATHPTVQTIAFFTNFSTLDEFKTFLAEQYANGTPVIVEYELAEEEIVPYTEEQQEAWNKIKALTTYKNITNITSEAYAKVTYMRDNGLDVYETKQNADKRYIETTEKLAEQKITVDGVITQVSETNKKLTNEYLTAEQVNAELDTTNENIEILSQKQAKTELTSEQFRIDIDKIINDGVSKVKTSMGYTFDDEGFKLDREGAETGTIIDEAKIKVVDKTGSSESDLLYAGYVKEGNTDYPEYVGQTIVASANMIVKNYLVVPNSRFEKYENPVLGGQGTGAFEV